MIIVLCTIVLLTDSLTCIRFSSNSSNTEAPFLDLNLSITNGIVSSKLYDKRDDFNFEKENFPFLDEDVPRSPSYGCIHFIAYLLC